MELGCDDLLFILGKSLKENEENRENRRHKKIDVIGKIGKIRNIGNKGKIGNIWKLNCPVWTFMNFFALDSFAQYVLVNVFTIFEDNPKNKEDPKVQECTKKEDNPKMRTTSKMRVSVPPGSQCLHKQIWYSNMSCGT